MSLWHMSLSAGVMIAMIAIIRALAINRLPKKMFLALWGIVLLRLLLPFSWSSPFSVYSFVNRQWAGEMTNIKAAAIIPAVPTENVAPASPNIMPTAGIPLWIRLWVIGMAFCTLYFAIAYVRCHHRFRTSVFIKNSFATEWLSEHQCRRFISIRQNSGITAPLTYGILHPVILMPIDFDWTDTKKVQYVLAHEYIHIRRFDGVIKFLLTIALCVHWFNPLVWAMYILANRDIELSCDEAVVRSFGEKIKSAYALALISMEEQKSGLAPFCNSFSKNSIEERIKSIMKIKKNSLLGTLIAMLLVVGVAAGFATSAVAAGANPTQITSGMKAIPDKTTVIDLSTDGEYLISAGQGKAQSLDYSRLNQSVFTFTQGQKVEIDVNHVSAFGEDVGSHSVKLIFQDTENHIVETIIGQSDKEEITIESAGTYCLIIQNNEQQSLWYSFTLK